MKPQRIIKHQQHQEIKILILLKLEKAQPIRRWDKADLIHMGEVIRKEENPAQIHKVDLKTHMIRELLVWITRLLIQIKLHNNNNNN